MTAPTGINPSVSEIENKRLNGLNAIMEKINVRFAPLFLVFGIKTNDDGKIRDVHRRAGTNASDKKALGPGVSVTLSDVRSFIDAVPTGADNILAGLDGSSWQVKADDVVRDFYENGGKTDEAGLNRVCDAIWSRIQGMRPARGPRTHALPNGERYAGSDLAEFQAAYANAMELMGATPALAKAIASNIRF